MVADKTASFDADVIVVGAGPSGLMVASELALVGVKVLVLERRGEPALPRAGTLQPRVLEVFDSRGLADRFLKRAKELHKQPEVTSVIWAGLPGIRYDDLDSTFPYLLLLAQMETEQILHDRVVELGGVVLRHHDVSGLTQDEDGVDVELVDQSGEKRTLRACYVVGCDGARSTVRTAAGIDFIGEDATRTAINVDARVENPWSVPLTVTNNENGWGMCYPLRDGINRFGLIDAIAMMQPRDAPVTLEEGRNILRRIFGTDFGITEVVTLSRFHNALFLADRFRAGRVFLVGESVRVHYPASGVGMNFCLLDAFNLSWKLAAAVQGWAPDWLLDSYETEQRPEVEALIDDVRRQCAIQFNYSKDMVALKRLIENELIPLESVNDTLRNGISGLRARYAAGEGAHPLVGRRLFDLKLVEQGSGRALKFFELLHQQQFVLLDLTGREPPPLPFATPHLRLVSAKPSVARSDLAGVAALLVRPDGHVAWVGHKPLAEEFPAAELQYWGLAVKMPAAVT